MRKTWLQLVIVAAVIVAGGFTIGTSLFGESESPPKKGDRAPDFALTTLEGESMRLSDLRGRTVVLNFWGSFCEPCVREMPVLQDVHEEFEDSGVTVVGVNLDEPTLTVRRFVERTGVGFPILLDRGQVQKQYGVMYYPTTFFITPEGKIKHIRIGEIRSKAEAVAGFR